MARLPNTRGAGSRARAAAAALRADAVADRLPVSRAVAACGVDERPATRLPATERVAMRAPPPCAAPARASGSGVKRGTTGSSVAAMQAPAANSDLAALWEEVRLGGANAAG